MEEIRWLVARVKLVNLEAGKKQFWLKKCSIFFKFFGS